jgi:LysM domain-containing protein
VASLTAHLVESGDHGRLGFRPDCPVCREQRLFGSLSSEPVVSRRAQAVLAGGVLAVSTAAPGAVLAQERDLQREGIAAPERPTGGELDDPGFDPGGETALPFETAPVPPMPAEAGEEDSGEGAPLEAEPGEDPDARLVPPSVPETLTTGESAPVPPAEAVPPGGPSAPREPSLDAVPPTAPTEQSSAGTDSEGGPNTGRRDPAAGRPYGKVQRERSASGEDDSGGAVWEEPLAGAPEARVVAPEETSVVATDGARVDASEQAPVGAAGTRAAARTSEARRRDEGFYVVASGDSLWSIAKRLLGADASPARVAREVNRLWSLNQDRIGTGDPDLLMVGTKLRLR